MPLYKSPIVLTMPAPLSRILYITSPLLLLATSCTVGPNYKLPPVTTPAQYKETETWKHANPRENEPKGPWWTVYHDPELSSLVSQVNISNQNVAEAVAAFQEACATVAVERSNLFPTITASPAYTREKTASGNSTNGGSSGGGGGVVVTTTSTGGGGSSSGTIVESGSGGTTIKRSTSSFNSYEFPATLSYMVDVWGAVRRSLESNKASAQASYADISNAELSYQGELAQDYFTLRGQEAEEEILTQTVANDQKDIDLTENKYKSGVDSEADIAQAKAQLSTAQAQLIDAGVTRATSEHAIAVLMGRPPSFLTVPGSPNNYQLPNPPPVPVGIPSVLLERRPDIAASERTVAAANAEIGVQEAAYYPQITIGANSSFNSIKLDELFSGPSLAWSVGPVVAQTIFNGGKFDAQVRLARATYDADVATYRQTVLTAFQQVEDAVSTLRILDKELDASRESVKASQDSLNISLNEYKAGTVDYLTVITSQNTLLTDQLTLVSIQTRRLVASVQLIEALGGGWDARLDLPAPDQIEGAPKPAAPDSTVP